MLPTHLLPTGTAWVAPPASRTLENLRESHGFCHVFTIRIHEIMFKNRQNSYWLTFFFGWWNHHGTLTIKMIIDSLEKWWVIVGGHPVVPSNLYHIGDDDRPWTGNPVLDQYQGMREGIQHGSKKNCSPFLIGKSTISMGHLYHGYVSHKQRVYCKYVTWGWGATHGDMTISMEGRSQSTHKYDKFLLKSMLRYCGESKNMVKYL